MFINANAKPTWQRVAAVLFAGWASTGCVLDLKKDSADRGSAAEEPEPDRAEATSTRTARQATQAAPNGCLDEARGRTNDTPETATPIKLGVPVPACMGDMDVDYYLVKVPAEDRAGGFFKVSVTDVGESGLAEIQAWVDSDKAPLISNDFGDHRGGPTFGYWTGAPGMTYRVSVVQFSNWVRPWDYTLKIDYTPIDDVYEPNDTQDDAQPIELDEPVKGFVFAGHAAGPIKTEQWNDWYELDLVPGTLTMKVTSVPRDVNVYLDLLDSAGVYIRPGPQPYGVNRGADYMSGARIPTAGKYKLRFGVYADPPETSGKTDVSLTVPDSYTRPYQLVVTQP